MLKKLNRVMNEGIARYCEVDLEIRYAFASFVADRCQSSNNENVRAFGDGMAIGIPEGEEFARLTPAFYRKYSERTLPSLWCARDLIFVMPGCLKNDDDILDFLKKALAH